MSSVKNFTLIFTKVLYSVSFLPSMTTLKGFQKIKIGSNLETEGRNSRVNRLNCSFPLNTDICSALLHLQPGDRIAELTTMIKLNVVLFIFKVISVLAFYCAESERRYDGLIFSAFLKLPLIKNIIVISHHTKLGSKLQSSLLWILKGHCPINPHLLFPSISRYSNLFYFHSEERNNCLWQ